MEYPPIIVPEEEPDWDRPDVLPAEPEQPAPAELPEPEREAA